VKGSERRSITIWSSPQSSGRGEKSKAKNFKAKGGAAARTEKTRLGIVPLPGMGCSIKGQDALTGTLLESRAGRGADRASLSGAMLALWVAPPISRHDRSRSTIDGEGIWVNLVRRPMGGIWG